MNDTNAVIEARFNKLIMKRSGEDRLLMGCSMFDAAKRIVKSSIIQKQPKISTQEIKIGIFSRLYGNEFNEIKKSKIVEALRKHD